MNDKLLLVNVSSILAIIRPKYESEENGGDTVKTTEKKFIIDYYFPKS